VTGLTIDGRRIGADEPPYVIAEISGNHNGDLTRALDIVDAAARHGADAVKLQTYTADTLTIDHDGPGFRLDGGLWSGRTLHELYGEAHTPWEWHEALFERGRAAGVTVFSSPFDPTAVELLESLGCPAYKIASPEIVDVGLIEVVAATGKPMVMSTGMATMDEIELALGVARDGGCRELLLLHCVSGYPTAPADAGLERIGELAAAFDVPVGFSDHTLGVAVAIAAVAVGAVAIEKHVTLVRADGGVDAAFSLEPAELGALVDGVRSAQVAVGPGTDGPSAAEVGSLVFRRSLYVVADVAAGEPLTTANIRSIRPAHGLPPRHLREVLGRTATRALERGEPLDWSMVDRTGR
jgi:pseudaminic acid synthase